MDPRFMDKKIYQTGEVIGELLIRPFQTFADREASSGILLLAATVLAIIWVNSPFHHYYDVLWESVVTLGLGSWSFEKTLHFWVNDGLMTVFFFVVGLEIKREILVGELASFRQAALPITAALGGMLVPAVIYLTFNFGTDVSKGWAIPMATDIALTLGVLTLLGSRVPHSLVIFLVALAIADDLGAVIVLALFYTSDISVYYLQVSGVIMLCLVIANILGYRRPFPFMLLGIALWAAVYLSGVHSTLAGVLLALTIPARAVCDTDTFLFRARNVLEEFQCAGQCGYSMYTNEDHQATVQTLENICHGVQPPLIRIEYTLHPWVVFGIVPLFGLANAGVGIEWAELGNTITSPLFLGIMIGLFLGKQVGILTATWLAIKIGLGAMPRDTTWRQIYGGAVLCGIGFTMSIFIAHLAFHQSPVFNVAKMSIFVGSVASAAVGTAILYRASDKSPGNTQDNHAA